MEPIAPRGPIMIRGGYWKVMCAAGIFGFVGIPLAFLVSVSDEATGPQIGWMIAGVAVGLLVACLLIRARLLVTADELVVINPVRTHRTAWTDIESVTVKPGHVRFQGDIVRLRVTPKGSTPYRVAAAAVYYDQRRRLLAPLYEAFAEHGIPVDEG